MKKLVSLLLVLALTLGCAAALADDPITLTYAEVNPVEGTIVGELAKAFKEKVEELSGGSVLIDIQASGVLGSEDQILDNLLGGGNVTDISRISAFALIRYQVPSRYMPKLPFSTGRYGCPFPETASQSNFSDTFSKNSSFPSPFRSRTSRL